MGVVRRSPRGGARCLVARDLADELERQADALIERIARELNEENKRADWAEERALRSVVLAVRKINLQE